MHTCTGTTRRGGRLAAGLTLFTLTLVASLALAQDKKTPPAAAPAKDVKIIPDAWKQAKAGALATPQEVDRLINQAHQRDKLEPSSKTTDSEFLRRVSLDLTGQLPTADEVTQFMADKDPKKRAKVIDKLLESEAFNQHWTRYWRDVMGAHATESGRRRLSGQFETWLTDQFKNKKSWAEITKAIVTANGDIRFDGTASSNPASWVYLLHSGNEASVERAAETSRVFLGMQIQCAQCHDHPTDIWKQNQFHEFAAYFARLRDRPIFEEMRILGFTLTSPQFGQEHRIPDKNDPRRGTVVHPKFLTNGESASRGLNDTQRRETLAKLITSKDNYWYSAAYVNRMWAELMGQGFTMPVDNMGPLQDVVYPEVLLRVSTSFRDSDYDIRGLFRLVMNTEAYQRQIRLGDAPSIHLGFAGVYPARLRADQLYDSLVAVLGPLSGGPIGGKPFGDKPAKPAKPFGGQFGFRNIFNDAFGFDPSTRVDEVEGSVSQALLMMNNQVINSRISATGQTNLARLLRSSPKDDDAVKAMYMHTLARRPSERELQTAMEYIRKVGNRNEAFEDLQWVLINSTEFQTRK
jgi:hypothetical protein